MTSFRALILTLCIPPSSRFSQKIQAQLATGKTKQANFVKPLPVYIVYFSSAALLDGRIVDYKDIYGRDAKALLALNMKDGGASLAPKPKPKPADQVAARSGGR